MTEDEKKADENEYYKTTWGYLKSYEYKEAFKKSYNDLSEEERKKQTEQLKSLPNWNKDIFLEISWIDIEGKKEIKEYIIKELQEKLGEEFKIIKQ